MTVGALVVWTSFLASPTTFSPTVIDRRYSAPSPARSASRCGPLTPLCASAVTCLLVAVWSRQVSAFPLVDNTHESRHQLPNSVRLRRTRQLLVAHFPPLPQ